MIYKGYTIIKTEQRGRDFYQIQDSEGRFLIGRPRLNINQPFKYDKIEVMYQLEQAKKIGLFVSSDSRIPIVYLNSVEKCEKAIDDVINGEYVL